MSDKEPSVPCIDLVNSDEDEQFDITRVNEDYPFHSIVQDCRDRLAQKLESIREQFVPLDNLYWFLELERIHISKSRFAFS